MKKDQLRSSTIDWITIVANKYGFDPETVEGIYREMAKKYTTHRKSKTLEFIHLYSEGRNENVSNVE